MDEQTVLHRVRTRWAAVGAAVAVVLGTGGIAVSGAANPQVVPSKVNITPCRILDTRTTTALSSGEARTLQVTGKQGGCNIPGDAVGVMMNVTLVSPQQGGFITVFPSGAARPNASNLNYVAGQAATPNLVDATLGPDGRVQLFASGGPVHLVADISSYTTGTRLTPAQLAQNRWDLDRGRPLSVPVGASPSHMVYDGTVVWTSMVTSNVLTRVNATTGARLSDVTVGDGPAGMAFDGSNIWVANSSSDTVSRIDAATGTKNLADIPVATSPRALAFDGSSIWVASGLGTVTRINAATGAKDPNTVSAAFGSTDIVFDGTNVWVANFSSNSVSRINTTTRAKLDVSVGAGPESLVFDGTTVWVSNVLGRSLSRIDAATGTKNPTDLAVGSVSGLAFDGTDVWVARFGIDAVSRFDATTGAKVGDDISVGDAPYKLLFDGANLWISLDAAGAVQRLRTAH